MMGGCLPDQPAFQKSKMRVVGNLKILEISGTTFFLLGFILCLKRHFDHIIDLT